MDGTDLGACFQRVYLVRRNPNSIEIDVMEIDAPPKSNSDSTSHEALRFNWDIMSRLS